MNYNRKKSTSLRLYCLGTGCTEDATAENTSEDTEVDPEKRHLTGSETSFNQVSSPVSNYAEVSFRGSYFFIHSIIPLDTKFSFIRSMTMEIISNNFMTPPIYFLTIRLLWLNVAKVWHS